MVDKDDHSSSIMIALLPINSDWCKIDLPHMTLVYAGEVKDQPPGAFNELAKDASLLATLSRPLTLRTNGTEVFGGRGYDDAMDVIRLRPTPELLSMRRVVERWNKSEYGFNPHVTIAPTGQGIPEIPGMIAFNKVLVGWGDEYLTFNMNY
jgi:2'-5' RNA ligase